jgi:hypothetical protein
LPSLNNTIKDQAMSTVQARNRRRCGQFGK